MDITTTDYNHLGEDGRLSFRKITVNVRFTKRTVGGWNVVRADNGRVLGWVVRDKFDDGKPCWSAHVSASAFCGDSIDDEGHILDDVPSHYHNGDGNRFVSHAVGYGSNREDAAGDILARLVRYYAPAVGYGRNPAVGRYEDRRR